MQAQTLIDEAPAEIVDGDLSGGANTSHTIVVEALSALLEAVPADASQARYAEAVLDQNVLGKGTEGARRRTYRYLRELYLLRPDSVLFRALRDLWPIDREAGPLLAGLCALARDPVFRASAKAIESSTTGDELTSSDFANVVGERFPGNYSSLTLAKIGRNTFSSWGQTGHLAGRGRPSKTRTRATGRPSNLAFALLLGHLQGVRGQALFHTEWARLLDRPTSELIEMAVQASREGMLEFRHAGGVAAVTFRQLLRPMSLEQGLLL